MRLDFIACKYTHFIQYGKTIEYFFAKRIRNFAEIKRISPPNGSHKTITKKQGVHETNEALLFFFAPKDFARCLNATCPRSQNCLRRTAALQDTDEHLFLKVVNPLRYPKEGEECELFRSTDKVRMAWGVTHLLDNVPYKEGSLLRNMIINHLGRSQYYRCFRKERPFSPQDQQTIRLLFRQRGISEEPSFDYYTNEFNW